MQEPKLSNKSVVVKNDISMNSYKNLSAICVANAEFSERNAHVRALPKRPSCKHLCPCTLHTVLTVDKNNKFKQLL